MNEKQEQTYSYRATVRELQEWLSSFDEDEEVFIEASKDAGMIIVREKMFALYDEPAMNGD